MEQKTPNEGKTQLKRIEMRRMYIDCAERVIRQEGIEALSIRRLAKELGLNSATMYSYFKDLDHLLTFVSLKFRKDYHKDLHRSITSDMDLKMQYIKLYEVYCMYSFYYPSMFLRMYFGPYSDNLHEIFDEYYEIYPEEMLDQALVVRELISNAGTYSGDRAVVKLLAEKGYIKPENIDLLAETAVRVHASYMYDIIRKPQLSETMCRKEFMEFLIKLVDSL